MCPIVVQLLLATIVPSSVPPAGPDGSCSAFRPLPEPASLAAAELASGIHPYVLRRRHVAAAATDDSSDGERTPPCDRPVSFESSAGLLELLDASASVSDLTAYLEGGGAKLGTHTTLAQALQRQDVGERLYYQTPLQLESETAARSLCGFALPRYLRNEQWHTCLGEEMLGQLSASRLSWLAMFIGTSGTGMAMHQDQLIAHVWGVQLAGRKRFVFCPESELSRCTSPSGVTVDAFNSSTWGTAEKSMDSHSLSSTGSAETNGAVKQDGSFSRFRPSACYHVSLEPGDLVYWPSRWLHQSYQQERSVALSSFSLGKQIASGFFKSMEQYFAGALDPKMVARMKNCSDSLPE